MPLRRKLREVGGIGGIIGDLRKFEQEVDIPLGKGDF